MSKLSLVTLVLVGCGADGSAADGAPTTGPYQVELTVLPGDVHPGDVVTFTFRVTRDGVPVSGLVPDARYEQATGDTVDWILVGRTIPNPSGHAEVHASQDDVDLDLTEVRRAQVTLDEVGAAAPSSTVLLSGQTTDPGLASATAPSTSPAPHQH